MDISNIPTVNLYKFAAIFGLVILLSSGGYAYIKYSAIENQKITFGVESKLLSAQVLNLKEEAAQARTDSKTGKYIDVDSLNKKLNTIEESRIKLDGKMDHLMYLEAEKKFLFMVGGIFVFIGMSLMIGGFVLWYLRIQKWQDKALKDLSKSNLPHSRGAR